MNTLNSNSNQADSAGQPWAGREFSENTYGNDDGSMPDGIQSALSAVVHEGNLTPLVTAFSGARWLIPLVAVAGDVGQTEDGLTVDKTQELSIVTVAAPDGRKALPVFSNVDAMKSWREDARPVPADGVRVALAAAAEETPIVVIDPGTPLSCVLRRPALWAIAQSRPWQPPHESQQIREIVSAVCAGHPAVRGFGLSTDDPRAQLAGSDLTIDLTLEPGLDHAGLNALLEQLVTGWNARPEFAEGVDALNLRVRPADAEA